MTFYDKNGNAVCYTEDNVYIYSFDGTPIAYIHGNIVWSYSGLCLGWLHNYWILDLDGYYLFFSEYSTGGMIKPFKHLRPLKGLRRLRPLKSIRRIPSLRPYPKLRWSTLTADDFFK